MTQPFPDPRYGYTRAPHEPLAGQAPDVELEALDLPVIGAIPPELDGVFARNSANPRHTPKGRYHWFDGDGLIHAIHLQGGKASYRSRYTQTWGLAQEQAAGRAIWPGILEPPQLDLPRGPLKDTANTDLTYWNGELVATWWLSGQPMAVDPRTLETRGEERFGGQLSRSVSAHPKVCPRTGDLIFFGYDYFRTPSMWYGAASTDGRVHVATVDARPMRIPHDVVLTERYTVLLDLPLGWDARALRAGKRRISFDKGAPSRFGFVPRWGGEVQWLEHDPCYVYHTIHCYEDGDEVVLVACRIADPIPDTPTTDRTVARLDLIELVPHLYRWRFNLKTGAVHGEQLDDLETEFPRANDQFWTYPARYSYNPRIARAEALTFDGIVKYDLETGARVIRDLPEGWTSGEVVYAPREVGTAETLVEDDGWVIALLTDGAASELWILDAQQLDAEPVARVPMPRRVPQGFHAEWADLRRD